MCALLTFNVKEIFFYIKGYLLTLNVNLFYIKGLSLTLNVTFFTLRVATHVLATECTSHNYEIVSGNQ